MLSSGGRKMDFKPSYHMWWMEHSNNLIFVIIFDIYTCFRKSNKGLKRIDFYHSNMVVPDPAMIVIHCDNDWGY